MRLMLKTCSYAIIHFMVATLVAYAISGSWAIALGIGLIEPLVQTAVFALHDWAWERPKSLPSFKLFCGHDKAVKSYSRLSKETAQTG